MRRDGDDDDDMWCSYEKTSAQRRLGKVIFSRLFSFLLFFFSRVIISKRSCGRLGVSYLCYCAAWNDNELMG